MDTPADIIKNWLRSRRTIDLLGHWEKLTRIAIEQMEILMNDRNIKRLEGNNE